MDVLKKFIINKKFIAFIIILLLISVAIKYSFTTAKFLVYPSCVNQVNAVSVRNAILDLDKNIKLDTIKELIRASKSKLYSNSNSNILPKTSEDIQNLFNSDNDSFSIPILETLKYFEKDRPKEIFSNIYCIDGDTTFKSEEKNAILQLYSRYKITFRDNNKNTDPANLYMNLTNEVEMTDGKISFYFRCDFFEKLKICARRSKLKLEDFERFYIKVQKDRIYSLLQIFLHSENDQHQIVLDKINKNIDKSNFIKFKIYSLNGF